MTWGMVVVDDAVTGKCFNCTYAAEVWVGDHLCCFGCTGVALQDWLKRKREFTDRVRRRS